MRNGAGTYILPAGNPVVTNTTISSTWANTTLSDIGAALTQSLSNDGQTPVVANLPMATFKHTNVAPGYALTDYARYDQLQNSTPQWMGTATGTDAIKATLTPAPTALTEGMTLRFLSAGANATTAVTLQINALTAVSVVKNGAAPLAVGDIPANGIVTVTYDGTNFQLVTGINIAMLDARYAAISFAQVQQPLTAAATLTAAQCQGQSYYVTGAGTYTLPSSGGAKVKFSCGIAGVVIAAPTGVNLLSPSGSATTAGSITLKPYQDISLEWNGTDWAITGGNFCNMVSGVDTDVTSSRVYGTSPTTYTNTSPFPRRCAITVTTSTTAGQSIFGVTVNGRPYWTNPYDTSSSAGIAVDVLPGETYSYYVSNATVGSIRETL